MSAQIPKVNFKNRCQKCCRVKELPPTTGPYPDPQESNPHPSISAPKVGLIYAQIHKKSVISVTVSRQPEHYRVIMRCLGVASVCSLVTNLTILSLTLVKNRSILE